MSDEQGEAAGSAASGEEPAANDADPDNSEAGPPLAEITERIERSEPAAIADEIVTLREEIAGLKTERDEFESRLKRKQAEFQNYKKRQEKRREEIQSRATEALVEELIEVRDNLNRALEQDESADIRNGVEATFRQLEDVLQSEGVEPLEPEPGTPTDPKRHEVLLGVESEHPAGTVDEVHRPGYEMSGKVLRPAQVTVSEGAEDGTDGETEPEGETGGHDGSDADAEGAVDE